MTVEPEIYATPEQLGEALAVTIVDEIAAAATEGRRYRLGCPTGRSPEPVYSALVAEVASRRQSVDHVDIVLMDDYVVVDPDGTPRRVDPALLHSCEGVTLRTLVEPLRAVSAEGGHGPGLWLPDPADPDAYEARIEHAGGIDLFLLASGATDGHIAFNPPYSSRTSRTRVVELAEATRRDNLVTFPTFGGIDDVPSYGVSVGIGTIADLSRSVAMVLHGPDKALAFQRIAAADGYEPDWPATILAECRSARLLADVAASGARTAVVGAGPTS
jgi:glucosamine-6-phosphate deaminase